MVLCSLTGRGRYNDLIDAVPKLAEKLRVYSLLLQFKRSYKIFSQRGAWGMVAGGRVVRWCWVNFQCRGVLLIWVWVGQGSISLAVGAVGLFGHFFSCLSLLFFSSPSLCKTARYRLKYCLKGPLSPN